MTGRDRSRTGVAELAAERMAAIAFGVAIAIYIGLVLWIGRDTTLFVDEYQLFTDDRGLDPYALLSPLNGHLVLVSRLIFAFDVGIFGADDLLAARLLEAIGGAFAATFLFALAVRRIPPLLAFAGAVLVLFLGSAWEITFIVSGIPPAWATAGGLGALLVLDRGNRRYDWLACLLLIVSVVSWTAGVAFALGAGVLILLGRGPRQRLWIVLVPLALYAAWFAWVRFVYVPDHGDPYTVELHSVLNAPSFIAQEVSATVGVMTGLDYPYKDEGGVFSVFGTRSPLAVPIAVIGALALVWRLWRRPVSPFLWASICIALAAWFLFALGVGPGRSPTTVRYTYIGAVVIVVIAAEALRGVRISRTVTVVAVAAVAIGLAANLGRLSDGASYYRGFSLKLRAQLAALDIARPATSSGFVPPLGPAQFDLVVSDAYFDAVDRVGSPAFSDDELSDKDEDLRAAADATLVAALGVSLSQPDIPQQTDCQRVTGQPVTVPIGPGGTVLRSPAPAQVSIRRYAETATQPLGELEPGVPVALRVPPDAGSQPWTVVAEPLGPFVVACPLASVG